MENITFEDPSNWISGLKKSRHVLPPEERVAQHGITQARGQEPTLQNEERNKPNPDTDDAVGSSGTL